MDVGELGDALQYHVDQLNVERGSQLIKHWFWDLEVIWVPILEVLLVGCEIYHIRLTSHV